MSNTLKQLRERTYATATAAEMDGRWQLKTYYSLWTKGLWDCPIQHNVDSLFIKPHDLDYIMTSSSYGIRIWGLLIKSLH